MIIIKAKPMNLYSIYKKAINNDLFTLGEENIINFVNNFKKNTIHNNELTGITNIQTKLTIRDIEFQEIQRALSIDESTFSTSTIEGIYMEQSDIDKYNNGIKNERIDIDDLHASMNLRELLDRLILPNMLTDQDIKD